MVDVENMMCRTNIQRNAFNKDLNNKAEDCLCDPSTSSLMSERFLKGTCPICGHELAQEGSEEMHGFRCPFCHCECSKTESQHRDSEQKNWDTSLRSLDGSQRSLIHRCPSKDDVMASLIENGDVQKSIGNYAGAVQQYQEALARLQKQNIFPHKNLDVARIFHKLGVVYGKLGNFCLAHVYLEKALGIKYCTYGVDTGNDDIVSTLKKLGNLYFEYHHFEDARYVYQSILECQHEVYGVNSINKALTYTHSKLGKILSVLGHFEEAQEQYETILALSKQEYGDGFINYDIASALHNLGILARERGQYQVALQKTEESIEMQRLLAVHSELNATNETAIAGTISSLGAIHYDMGDLKEAQKSYEDALKTLRHVRGNPSKNTDIARMLFNIGMIHEKLGCKTAAHLKYSEALKMVKNDTEEDAVSDASDKAEVPPLVNTITERLRLLSSQKQEARTT